MNFKNILTSVIIGCLSLTTVAQITVTQESFPQAGDTLFVKTDNLPTAIHIGRRGPAQNWDFTSLEAPFTRQTMILQAQTGRFSLEFPQSQLMTQLPTGERYFDIQNENYVLLGYAGLDPLGLGVETMASFDSPYVQQRSPMNYEDENSFSTSIIFAFEGNELNDKALNQIPIRPDSVRIRYDIERKDEVDAWGTMTIPGGIYDVLREKRVEQRTVVVEAKIGLLDWQNITTFFPYNDLFGTKILTSYHFYSNESIAPIAVVQMAAEGGKVQSVDYKSEELTTNTVSSSSIGTPNIYTSPNPAIGFTRFEFANLPPATYELKIYNILGVELWSQTYFVNGNRVEKVELAGFRKGTYLYSLLDSSGKSIATKRLMIVRP